MKLKSAVIDTHSKILIHYLTFEVWVQEIDNHEADKRLV